MGLSAKKHSTGTEKQHQMYSLHFTWKSIQYSVHSTKKPPGLFTILRKYFVYLWPTLQAVPHFLHVHLISNSTASQDTCLNLVPHPFLVCVVSLHPSDGNASDKFVLNVGLMLNLQRTNILASAGKVFTLLDAIVIFTLILDFALT